MRGPGAEPMTERKPLPFGNGRLLVVDDEAEVRDLMKSALERRGYEVVAVESGAEALAYLAYDTPSLILLDLDMDDMTGWEVLSALEPHRHGRFRIVVVTGSSATLPKWIGHMRKPFRIDALMELLDGMASQDAEAP